MGFGRAVRCARVAGCGSNGGRRGACSSRGGAEARRRGGAEARRRGGAEARRRGARRRGGAEARRRRSAEAQRRGEAEEEAEHGHHRTAEHLGVGAGERRADRRTAGGRGEAAGAAVQRAVGAATNPARGGAGSASAPDRPAGRARSLLLQRHVRAGRARLRPLVPGQVAGVADGSSRTRPTLWPAPGTKRRWRPSWGGAPARGTRRSPTAAAHRWWTASIRPRATTGPSPSI